MITLYVMADDFCQLHTQTDEKQVAGRPRSLPRSEAITLALFGQWIHFESEQGFYWYAEGHLCAAFLDLLDREQFNRLMQAHRDVNTAFGLHLVQVMQEQNCPYELLGSITAVTHDTKRHGAGWLAGQADIRWSNRLSWHKGFHLLLCVTSIGVITEFGFVPANTHDQLLASMLFAARAQPLPRLPNAGLPA